MPRPKKKRTPTPWSRSDLSQLKKLAGRHNASAIARVLKRTASAVRQKAFALHISLRLR